MQMFVCKSVFPAFMHGIGVQIHCCTRVCVCVCQLESRLYGLADYQGLCKRSLSVYSALFVGGIWKKQTAIWSNQPRWAMNRTLSLHGLVTPVCMHVCVCLCLCGPLWKTEKGRDWKWAWGVHLCSLLLYPIYSRIKRREKISQIADIFLLPLWKRENFRYIHRIKDQGH